MHEFFSAVTDLGDSGFAAALTVFLAFYLAAAGGRRQAMALVLAFTMAAGGIAAAKIAALACGSFFAGWDIRSPSGHAAVAASVYGTAAAIAVTGKSGRKRIAIPVTALGLIGLIAFSRVTLQAHTVAEVGAGLAIGFLSCGVALCVLRKTAPVAFDARILMLCAGIAAVLFYGNHVDAENLMRRLALLFGKHGIACST